MARARTGSIVERHGLLYARVTFVDEDGIRRDKLRRADDRTHARSLIKKMLNEVDAHGAQTLDAERMTFAQLCDHYEEHYLTEADYVNGRKVSGLRSLATPKGFLKTIRAYFKSKYLRKITHGDIRAYRSARLKTPTRRKVDKDGNPVGQRSITSVNRELALLRRMFNVAQREGWILRNPFHAGDALISVADEQKRERILTRDEERRLLNACTGRREHLREIIIAAIDTGMRKGELLSLQWKDVHLDDSGIVIQALNTKTLRERTVPMTIRLYAELRRMSEERQPAPDELVFGIVCDVKRSFDAARHAAGITDIRFHDLRHTHATRLVGAGIPLAEVARGLGHQQLSTTYRYTNQTEESARRRAEALDAYNEHGYLEGTATLIN